MGYYYQPDLKDDQIKKFYYNDYINSDFIFYYYFDLGWLPIRPATLYILYPQTLLITQDPCYSGYTYNDANFEGTYFGTSTTPTNTILFVYKQFNTDILFQSISAPTPTFKVPSKSTSLILQSDLTDLFIGVRLSNTSDTNNLILTTN